MFLQSFPCRIMLITCVFLFLLCIQDRIAEKCCNTVEDTELVMAFLVHRHGDRAPEKAEIFLSDDRAKLADMSEPYGYGQLTDSGTARSFVLGQFLRRRYNQFLSSCYNSSDIFVRSTDMNRTQMTAKIAITAAYSPKGLWSDDMELIPVEMNVISASVDPNLCLLNCPKLMFHFLEMLAENKNPKDMQIYDELIDILSEHRGFILPKNPLVLYGMSDVFASQESVGMPLSDFNRRLMPTIRQAAGLAVNYLYGDQTYVPLQAGVLLKEFFETANQIISGAEIPKLRVLSAHDFNVYSFMAATRAIPRQGSPRYCSVYSLELRRCKNSGEYVVVPVYVKSPEEPEAYLEIEDCGVICDYKKFRNITAKNVMTEQQFKTRCKLNNAESAKKGQKETNPLIEKLFSRTRNIFERIFQQHPTPWGRRATNFVPPIAV